LTYYMFGSLLPCNFDECKLSLIFYNNWQQSLQEPDIDVVLYVTVRCHYSHSQLHSTSISLFHSRDLQINSW
jgi:hypothetical protein